MITLSQIIQNQPELDIAHGSGAVSVLDPVSQSNLPSFLWPYFMDPEAAAEGTLIFFFFSSHVLLFQAGFRIDFFFLG